MSDSTSISGAVKISHDSAARVALDLMERISTRENPTREQQASREYWLTLFHQCMKAASGYKSLESILKSE